MSKFEIGNRVVDPDLNIGGTVMEIGEGGCLGIQFDDGWYVFGWLEDGVIPEQAPEGEEIQIEMEDGSAVVLYGEEHEVVIAGEIVHYREGVWLERGDDGELYPDWDLTWFYKDTDHPQEYIYYEQDPPEVALHNLRRILERSDGSWQS